MRFLIIALLALLAAGCGEKETPAGGEAAPPQAQRDRAEEAAAAVEEAHHFEPGHSAAVREYYGAPHSHEDDAAGDTEAEYHEPPRPAAGGRGDAITLTGTNLGVRMRVTISGLLDPVRAARAGAGKRYVGVQVRVVNTGIAIFESTLRDAFVTFGDARRARAVTGVAASCSNGFEGPLRIDVGDEARGCLLFALPDGATPKLLRLALEQVPADAGGKWRLR
jgi:hypothetical protein